MTPGITARFPSRSDPPTCTLQYLALLDYFLEPDRSMPPRRFFSTLMSFVREFSDARSVVERSHHQKVMLSLLPSSVPCGATPVPCGATVVCVGIASSRRLRFPGRRWPSAESRRWPRERKGGRRRARPSADFRRPRVRRFAPTGAPDQARRGRPFRRLSSTKYRLVGTSGRPSHFRI